MLKKELKKEYKKADLEVVSLKNLIPLHLSKQVLGKIGYLCHQISKEEWSGVLFYSVKGSLAQFDKVEFTVEDIYPMDKGTAGATEYELGEELIEYRMANPKSLKWKMGHVHSHNTMRTYFSGTDMSELNDNSEHHNYYLSLIVNNFMDMVAKVAFRGQGGAYICKDEVGKEWNLTLSNPREVLFTFDCDIKSQELPKVEENFSTRVATIIKKADSVQKKMAEKFNTAGTTHFTGGKEKDIKVNSDWFKGGSNPLFELGREEEEINLDEDFTRFVLRLGDEDIYEDTLEAALEDISISNVSQHVFSGSILNQYSALYEKYWNDFEHRDYDSFIDTTESVIEILEESEDTYPFTVQICINLKMMLAALTKPVE